MVLKSLKDIQKRAKVTYFCSYVCLVCGSWGFKVIPQIYEAGNNIATHEGMSSLLRTPAALLQDPRCLFYATIVLRKATRLRRSGSSKTGRALSKVESVGVVLETRKDGEITNQRNFVQHIKDHPHPQ